MISIGAGVSMFSRFIAEPVISMRSDDCAKAGAANSPLAPTATAIAVQTLVFLNMNAP
jgi:hypothetical protein